MPTGCRVYPKELDCFLYLFSSLILKIERPLMINKQCLPFGEKSNNK